MPGRRAPLVQRLISRVQEEDGRLDTPCWTWTGSRRGGQGGDKYGSIRLGGRGTPMALTHVVAYRLFVGDVDDECELDHRCANRLCCNPRHLEPVSREENLQRHFKGYAHTDERVPFDVPSGEPSGIDLEFFEERAAIREFLGGLPRNHAERLALEDVHREQSPF